MSLGVINLHTYGAKVFMKSVKKFKTQNFTIYFQKCQSSIKLVKCSIAGTYLQTPLPLPEFFPIGQLNIFK